MKKWILTNKTIEPNYTGLKKYSFGSFIFGSERSFPFPSKDNHYWLIDGHIVPRQNLDSHYSRLLPEALCEDLYKKYKDSFINKIKGNFVLIRLYRNNFSIFSDRFGIKKFFYYQSGEDYIISNDLGLTTSLIDTKPSLENMSIYALTYHFVGGKTLFKEIKYNDPGQIIKNHDGTIKTSFYWNPESLLKSSVKSTRLKNIAEALEIALQAPLNNIAYQKSISLSLTGGADTRNLLATCLKNQIDPHLYTYGNPLSADCIKATAISNGLKLNHDIHDVQMNADLFGKYARKVVKIGNSLASIHRSHRLIAVECEKKYAEYMMLGTLGGEFIKGVSEDDYIVPSIVYDNWTTEQLDEPTLLKYLEMKSINAGNVDLNEILELIKNLPFFKNDVVHRKFFSLTDITTRLHDAQDLNLYSSVMSDVFTPFLDIDYLEIVFSSGFTFNNKETIKNKYLKRIENPVYASKLLKHIYPPLLQFEYCGEHKPSEILFNKYYAAVVKQIRKKMRPVYPVNFQLGDWMKKFVETYLPSCNDYDVLKKTFNLNKLQEDLMCGMHQPKESYWLRFTNPIMMKFILDEYGK